MSESARSVPSDALSSGVVRPISRAATRRCSRPGCPALATATLTFRYDEQHARLAALVPDGGPETYDLCGEHADRTRPPFGWSLKDDRPEEVSVDTPDVADLSSARTVAVLAAALRGDTDEPADAQPPAVDTTALDAIVDEPFDDPGGDLYATVDEADPVTGAYPQAPVDALSELSALSEHTDEPGPDPAADHDEPDHDEPDVVEQVPARTVPGAHRPD